MLFDSHVHIGLFYNNVYFSPQMVLDACKQSGVTGIAVSSTTIAEENYPKVLAEFGQLLSQTDIPIVPVLWVTPRMLQTGGIRQFRDSGIRWQCIKVHNYLQRGAWGEATGALMQQVVDLAQDMHLPILFHTGNDKCYPDDYAPLIKSHPEQVFILAHSRPVNQTIRIMQSCPNAWADTAFTPLEDIVQMVNAGLIDRMLWGTDLPLMGYYYGVLRGSDINQYDFKGYYTTLLSQLQTELSAADYLKLTYQNAARFYSLPKIGQ